jgi:predicted ATPase
LYISQLLRGELASARETAEDFQRDAESAGRMTEAAAASRTLGMACLYQGAFGEAQTHLGEALRLCDPERDRDAKFRFGADTAAAAATYLAQIKWYLGEIHRASDLIEQSGRRAVESGNPPTLALIHHLRGVFDMQRGDAAAVLSVSETLIELSQEHRMALYHTLGSVEASWARARLGGGKAGLSELGQAIAAYADGGNKVFLSLFEGLHAELEAERSGDGALTRINDAVALSQQTGEHWSDSFLHRIRGEILLKYDPANTAPAREAFLTAIAVAKQQKAKSFELRAAMSLARLWRDQGKVQQARELLAPVYGWFTEGFDTRDLKEAKALLEELA